jgi:hypothetical protein
MLHDEFENEAGKLIRSFISCHSLPWVFLDEHVVEPTNNRMGRVWRFGVLLQKHWFGSQSDKGERWVERILSIKETCHLKSKASFPALLELVQVYFKKRTTFFGLDIVNYSWKPWDDYENSLVTLIRTSVSIKLYPFFEQLDPEYKKLKVKIEIFHCMAYQL